jgi:HD-GYP domain-containing protein (c-di-GMP phosphodiesterase class II)
MDNELFKYILGTQKVEYGLFDSSLNLIDFSPGISQFLSADSTLEIGSYICDVFTELEGYQNELTEIQKNIRPSLQLNWMSQLLQSYSHEYAERQDSINFFNIQVCSFSPGLIVILRDITNEGTLEQAVYNQRNELDILTQQLIEDLKQANLKLSEAYKTTLEGWANALEMRDVETKGHSERVVNLTCRLATWLGVDETEIEFYYYGALLHDIGKMGIPDRILLKTGSLTDDEQAIMRQHPLFAENLLKPIKYLEKALCIPVYHHEMWDGNGYPYGLKGKEIPLPARIFSIVDVYDALTNNRPYRKALTKKDALRYITDHSGVDFDPQIVKIFVRMVNKLNL